MARQDVMVVPVETQASRPPVDAAFEDLYRRSIETGSPASLKLRDWVQRAEAWRIAQALRECRGNRSAAARSLGIGRRTLYSKMEKLGLGPAWAVWGTPPPRH
jgi:DNA-binding NtrC family response regulator